LGQWVVSAGSFRARQHARMVLYIGRFTVWFSVALRPKLNLEIFARQNFISNRLTHVMHAESTDDFILMTQQLFSTKFNRREITEIKLRLSNC